MKFDLIHIINITIQLDFIVPSVWDSDIMAIIFINKIINIMNRLIIKINLDAAD